MSTRTISWCRYRRTVRYTELAPLLSSLLSVGERAARASVGGVREEVFGLVAETCQVVAAMMAKLGETDLAWVGRRPSGDGRRAGAPLLAVAGVYRLAQAFVAGWKFDQAERAAFSDALGLAGRLHDGDPQVASLYGALNLVRAIVVSRRGKAVTAWEGHGRGREGGSAAESRSEGLRHRVRTDERSAARRIRREQDGPASPRPQDVVARLSSLERLGAFRGEMGVRLATTARVCPTLLIASIWRRTSHDPSATPVRVHGVPSGY
jgi:hypothetical protein